MNRSCALALVALLAFWLAVGLLLLTAITPATGTPPAAAGRIPASEFVALRSAGITASGNPPTIPALHQPRTPSPSAAAQPVRSSGEPSGQSPSPAASVAGNPQAGHVSSIRGVASWFRSPIGVSAAGPALRAALGPKWRGVRVTVKGPAGEAVTVLGDFMRRDRLIDLDASVFPLVCGELSRGICNVEVTR